MAYFKVATVPVFAWKSGDEAHNLRTVDIQPVTFQTRQKHYHWTRHSRNCNGLTNGHFRGHQLSLTSNTPTRLFTHTRSRVLFQHRPSCQQPIPFEQYKTQISMCRNCEAQCLYFVTRKRASAILKPLFPKILGFARFQTSAAQHPKTAKTSVLSLLSLLFMSTFTSI